MELEGSLSYSQQPATVSILSQMNTIHSLMRYFCKIDVDISLPSTTRSSELPLPFRFPSKILYAFLMSHVCQMSCPSHTPWLDNPNNIWSGLRTKSHHVICG